MTDYERERLENLKKNRELMVSLGLTATSELVPVPVKKPSSAPPKKKTKPNPQEENNADEATGQRRSLRLLKLQPDDPRAIELREAEEAAAAAIQKQYLRPVGDVSLSEIFLGRADDEDDEGEDEEAEAEATGESVKAEATTLDGAGRAGNREADAIASLLALLRIDHLTGTDKKPTPIPDEARSDAMDEDQPTEDPPNEDLPTEPEDDDDIVAASRLKSESDSFIRTVSQLRVHQAGMIRYA
jgi:hypothetical protein